MLAAILYLLFSILFPSVLSALATAEPVPGEGG